MKICALKKYLKTSQKQLIIRCNSKITLVSVSAQSPCFTRNYKTVATFLLTFRFSIQNKAVTKEQMVRAATSPHSSSLTANWVHVLIHHETNSLRNVKLYTKQPNSAIKTVISMSKVNLTSQNHASSCRYAEEH